MLACTVNIIVWDSVRTCEGIEGIKVKCELNQSIVISFQTDNKLFVKLMCWGLEKANTTLHIPHFWKGRFVGIEVFIGGLRAKGCHTKTLVE
jgi:hypothetical protein